MYDSQEEVPVSYCSLMNTSLHLPFLEQHGHICTPPATEKFTHKWWAWAQLFGKQGESAASAKTQRQRPWSAKVLLDMSNIQLKGTFPGNAEQLKMVHVRQSYSQSLWITSAVPVTPVIGVLHNWLETGGHIPTRSFVENTPTLVSINNIVFS